MRAVRLTSYGGLDGLELSEVPEPVAREAQVLVDVTRAGVNFADISRRRGTYDAGEALPRFLDTTGCAPPGDWPRASRSSCTPPPAASARSRCSSHGAGAPAA